MNTLINYVSHILHRAQFINMCVKSIPYLIPCYYIHYKTFSI